MTRIAMLLLIPAAMLAGCAGQAARTNALAPSIVSHWDGPLGVKAEAELGIRARGNPTAAAALGVPHESAGVLQQRRDFLAEWDRNVHLLTGPQTAAPAAPR